jgi:hypothetical protein
MSELMAGLEAIPPAVPSRPLVVPAPTTWFELSPGDRILVGVGEPVTAGLGLAERRRDPRLEVGPPTVADEGDAAAGLAPGDWWAGDGHESGVMLRRRRPRTPAGEVLLAEAGRWQVIAGDHTELLEAPAAGIVRDVVAGRGIGISLAGYGIPGAFAAGGPTRGRLELVAGEAGLRGSLDVGRAGSILVVGGRLDSETISRARAMGVRGIVVPGLAGKDLRDLVASEARQRASLQAIAPFAVLVLDGTFRRPIPTPLQRLFESLDGREVGFVSDTPLLVVDPPLDRPSPPEGWVRIRHGELAGREGRWHAAAGRRRFPAGVHLEAATIELDDGAFVVVPLPDLERFS